MSPFCLYDGGYDVGIPFSCNFYTIPVHINKSSDKDKSPPFFHICHFGQQVHPMCLTIRSLPPSYAGVQYSPMSATNSSSGIQLVKIVQIYKNGRYIILNKTVCFIKTDITLTKTLYVHQVLKSYSFVTMFYVKPNSHKSNNTFREKSSTLGDNSTPTEPNSPCRVKIHEWSMVMV